MRFTISTNFIVIATLVASALAAPLSPLGNGGSPVNTEGGLTGVIAGTIGNVVGHAEHVAPGPGPIAQGASSEVHNANANPTIPNGNDAGGVSEALSNVPKKAVVVPLTAAQVAKALAEVPASGVEAAAAVAVGYKPSVRRDVRVDSIAAPIVVDVDALHP